MGALHDGHRSLIRMARSRADQVAVSIFVNPLQFGPSEDYARYPRPIETDLAACEAEGVDIVFVPTVTDLYPAGRQVSVSAGAAGHGVRGRGPPRAFRRRAHRGAQAVQHHPARYRGLRPEGCPAAGLHPADGGRPQRRRGDHRRADHPRTGRPGHVQPQRLSSAPPSAHSGSACSPRWRRPRPRPRCRRPAPRRTRPSTAPTTIRPSTSTTRRSSSRAPSPRSPTTTPVPALFVIAAQVGRHPADRQRHPHLRLSHGPGPGGRRALRRLAGRLHGPAYGAGRRGPGGRRPSAGEGDRAAAQADPQRVAGQPAGPRRGQEDRRAARARHRAAAGPAADGGRRTAPAVQGASDVDRHAGPDRGRARPRPRATTPPTPRRRR